MKDTKDKLPCSGHSIDVKILETIKEEFQIEEYIPTLSGIFKAMGDPTRIRIIYLLSLSPLCVCDIATLLDMTQSSISHQLRILRDLRIVKFKKEGKLVIYSLDDDHVLKILAEGLNHAKHK